MDPIHQTVADELKRKIGSEFEFAWILNERQKGPHPEKSLYWAAMPKGFEGPCSALVKLVQVIFDQHKDLSFFLLRNRIYTTADISDMDRGLIRLTAKRATGRVVAQNRVDLDVSTWICCGEPHGVIPRLQSRQNFRSFSNEELGIQDRFARLEGQILRQGDLHDQGRLVSAFLVDSASVVRAESIHQGVQNKTLHAEVALCQDYYLKYGQRFQEGDQLFVSLKPCAMCAAMIDQMSSHLTQFRVNFLRDDPGTAAQNTILEKKLRLFQINV